MEYLKSTLYHDDHGNRLFTDVSKYNDSKLSCIFNEWPGAF